MAVVLGLHCGHDGAAAVVRDGRLLAAVAVERLTRGKKYWGLEECLLDYVFEAAGVTLDDVDLIACSDYHERWARGVAVAYRDGESVEHCWQSVFGDDVWDLEFEVRGRRLPGVHPPHHLAHCASAYYTSPFDEAYCFSMDSSGGKRAANSVVAHGEGLKLWSLYCPNLMVGCAYGYFCEQLGLGHQILKAGTLMGLAAYGTSQGDLDRLVDGAFIEEDSKHHDYMAWAWRTVAGQDASFDPAESDSQRAMHVAATIQEVFERCVLRVVSELPDDLCSNLCLSGGSLLNCNTNARVAREGRFEHVHLFPACSDDGLAVGAALYAAHHLLDEPRWRYADDELAYLGRERPTQAEVDPREVAQAIADGEVVAWVRGRCEFGPRALGHRSLLADPRQPGVVERLNKFVKQREWFRPFAPTVLNEAAHAWFDLDRESPFMLLTAQSLRPQEVPAVTHVDGTARPQTLRWETDPLYYDVVSEFKALTGVPMVLNTSLNGRGEPLVESDEDALRFWEDAPVDRLVLDGRTYRR